MTEGGCGYVYPGSWLPAQEVVLLIEGLSSPTLFAARTSQHRVLRMANRCNHADQDEYEYIKRVVEGELKDREKPERALAAARPCLPVNGIPDQRIYPLWVTRSDR